MYSQFKLQVPITTLVMGYNSYYLTVQENTILGKYDLLFIRRTVARC